MSIEGVPKQEERRTRHHPTRIPTTGARKNSTEPTPMAGRGTVLPLLKRSLCGDFLSKQLRLMQVFGLYRDPRSAAMILDRSPHPLTLGSGTLPNLRSTVAREASRGAEKQEARGWSPGRTRASRSCQAGVGRWHRGL